MRRSNRILAYPHTAFSLKNRSSSPCRKILPEKGRMGRVWGAGLLFIAAQRKGVEGFPEAGLYLIGKGQEKF